MTQPLAIEGTAFTEAKGWRRGQHLIDALPYIDSLTAEEKRTVDKMIEEEMRLSAKSPADYLKDLPPLPPLKFEGHPLLQQEYERVRQEQPLPPMDATRLRLDPPPLTRRNDPAAWKAALDNAHCQLEHQYNRLLNLELLLKFGPNAWRAHNDQLDAHNKQLEGEVAAARKDIESTNKARKLHQTATAAQLRALEGEWMALTLKNMDIGSACARLEAEVAHLQQQQQEQGKEHQPEEADTNGVAAMDGS